jgi:hypothetical protein
MTPRMPPPDNIGPPYFEIHAEGWGLIVAALWLLVGMPLLIWAHN